MANISQFPNVKSRVSPLISSPDAPYLHLDLDTKLAHLNSFNEWLRGQPIWAVTKLEGNDAKQPFQPNGERVMVNDPATWVSFDAALAGLRNHGWDAVGLVAHQNLNLLICDMDDMHHMVNVRERPRADLFHDLINRMDTYVELSSSYNGYHVFAGGVLEEANRRVSELGIELFGSNQAGTNHFVIITGLSNGRPIQTDNGTLQQIYNELPSSNAADLPDTVDGRSAEQVIERIKGSKNYDNVRHMFEIGYPAGCDKSQEDFKAIEHILFFTQDQDLVREIFESLPGWDEARIQEKKQGLTRRDYIGDTMRNAYGKRLETEDRERQEIEHGRALTRAAITAHSATKAATPTLGGHIEPPADSGALLSLYNHALKNAYVAFPEGALNSAIAHLGSIVGAKYTTPTKAGTNIYALTIADSGWGKEGCIAKVQAIMNEAGRIVDQGSREEDLLFSKLIVGKFGSVQAVQTRLEQYRNVMLWSREHGKALKWHFGGKNNTSDMIDFETALYTMSNEGSVYGEYLVNTTDSKTDPIYRPMYSFIGETTPEDLQDLDEVRFADGSTARYLYARALSKPKKNRNRGKVYDFGQLEQTIQLMRHCHPEIQEIDLPNGVDKELRNVHVTVKMKQEAWELYEQVEDRTDAFSEAARSRGNKVEASCLNRYMENAIKIATIVAVCRNAQNPEIEVADLQWAFLVTDASNKVISDLWARGDIGGVDDHARIVRVKEILARWISPCKDTSHRLKHSRYARYETTPEVFPRSAVADFVGRKHFPDGRVLDRILDEMMKLGLIAEHRPTDITRGSRSKFYQIETPLLAELGSNRQNS